MLHFNLMLVPLIKITQKMRKANQPNWDFEVVTTSSMKVVDKLRVMVKWQVFPRNVTLHNLTPFFG